MIWLQLILPKIGWKFLRRLIRLAHVFTNALNREKEEKRNNYNV